MFNISSFNDSAYNTATEVVTYLSHFLVKI